MAELRDARAGDGDAIAAIFLAARAAALAYLPVLHTRDDVRAFFGARVANGATTVAVDGERLVGFVVLGDARVEHLYVDPAGQRRGVGSLLLRHAQALRRGGLDLWVFQRNRDAIAFYEAHGFVIAETTKGSCNEEHEPDARMVWPGG